MKNIINFSLFFLLLVGCKAVNRQNEFLTDSSCPKIHYSSAGHNVGAPISLIFESGTYNLFYLESNSTANEVVSVYHVESTDLIHWKNPNKLNLTIDHLQPSYVVIVDDSQNTTGFGSSTNSPLIALLLINPGKKDEMDKSYIKLCYSLNLGKSWITIKQKIEFPDIVKSKFKPSIIWEKNSRSWVMTIVDDRTIKFYSSKDLKTWKSERSIEKEPQYRDNVWLKATIFPINNGVDWVMLVDQEFVNPRDGSTVQYFIGKFNGHGFTTKPSAKSYWLDYGKDNIYNVVCSGLSNNSNPIIIGLKNNIDYSLIGSMKQFWGSLTFPRMLSIGQYSGESILISRPISSIQRIKGREILLKNLIVSEKLDISPKITLALTPSVISLKFKTTQMTRMTFPSKFGIQFENDNKEKLIVGYDTFKQSYYVDRTNFLVTKENSQFKSIDIMSSYHSDSTMEFCMIMDDSSIELFSENGKQVLTENYFAEHNFNKLSLFAENGVIKVNELTIKNLMSIWKKKD